MRFWRWLRRPAASRKSPSAFVFSAAVVRICCSSWRTRSPPAAVMRAVSFFRRSNSSRCSGVKWSSRCATRSPIARSSASSFACSSCSASICPSIWRFFFSSFSEFWWRSCTRPCRKASRLRAETRSGFRRSSFARAATAARSACVDERCACARSRSAASISWRPASSSAWRPPHSPCASPLARPVSSSCLAIPWSRNMKNSRWRLRFSASRRLYSSASSFWCSTRFLSLMAFRFLVKRNRALSSFFAFSAASRSYSCR
mmetsp:Transcript_84138/g.238700  ORF Transcript_84138/g.238700 Transcript_84138/m.238700 type:complete len:259 (-) Transcript_84138:585-1361(-)